MYNLRKCLFNNIVVTRNPTTCLRIFGAFKFKYGLFINAQQYKEKQYKLETEYNWWVTKADAQSAHFM